MAVVVIDDEKITFERNLEFKLLGKGLDIVFFL